VIRRIFGICGKTAIFRRRYIDAILTNKLIIAFPLTPKHVTLNDLEWPFCVKLFCAGMFGALKPGFRSLATLKLVVNVIREL